MGDDYQLRVACTLQPRREGPDPHHACRHERYLADISLLIHTMLAVISPGAQKYAEEAADVTVDSTSLSELTGLGEVDVNNGK